MFVDDYIHEKRDRAEIYDSFYFSSALQQIINVINKKIESVSTSLYWL